MLGLVDVTSHHNINKEGNEELLRLKLELRQQRRWALGLKQKEEGSKINTMVETEPACCQLKQRGL